MVNTGYFCELIYSVNSLIDWASSVWYSFATQCLANFTWPWQWLELPPPSWPSALRILYRKEHFAISGKLGINEVKRIVLIFREQSARVRATSNSRERNWGPFWLTHEHTVHRLIDKKQMGIRSDNICFREPHTKGGCLLYYIATSTLLPEN